MFVELLCDYLNLIGFIFNKEVTYILNIVYND